MRHLWARYSFYLASALASAVLAFLPGCASGGFKLTRQYAGWVNRQNNILRVIIYILGIVIFVVTLVVDAVINNTLDFWEGRVSAGDYKIQDGGNTYYAHHEFRPGTQLRRSTIRAYNEKQELFQEVELSETLAGEIEVYVDGQLRTRVKSTANTPVATIFDEHGNLLHSNFVLVPIGPSQPLARSH